MADVTISDLQSMKDNGQKIFGIVAWDYHMATIADRAGADIISVGDTVGYNLWGHNTPFEVTVDQMMVVAQAVRRGTKRALLSVDLPFGPIQQSIEDTVASAIRFVKEAGVDIIKLDCASEYPEATAALVRAGIPVWAQMGITPQSALSLGIPYTAMNKEGAVVSSKLQSRLIDDAIKLQGAGASLLDFTNSGPVIGPKVVEKISIPVMGGFGGGPWLDGRVRLANSAIGYNSALLDADGDNYADITKIALSALSDLREDVRSGKQIKTGAINS